MPHFSECGVKNHKYANGYVMKKRELWLLGLLGVILFIVTTYVCVYQWGYSGLKLAANLINAVLNIGLIGYLIYIFANVANYNRYGKYTPHVMSVITFWQIEYERNPIMEAGRKIPVDCRIVLLKLVCDPEYVAKLNLPDIGDHELNRYYTSMYIRMVDCIGLPEGLTYRAFTRHMATYLQGLTANPVKSQTGNGLVDMIGEYDGRKTDLSKSYK